MDNKTEFKVIDAWAREAVEIETPAKCFDCENKEIAKPEKNDIILQNDRYYGCPK